MSNCHSLVLRVQSTPLDWTPGSCSELRHLLSPLSPLSPLSQLLHTYWPDHWARVSNTFLSGTSRLEPVTSTSVRESEGLTPGYDVWCLPLILVFAHSVNYARLACLNIIILLLITCSPAVAPAGMWKMWCRSIVTHWETKLILLLTGTSVNIECATFHVSQLSFLNGATHYTDWRDRWQVILRLDIKLLTKLSTYDLLANIWIIESYYYVVNPLVHWLSARKHMFVSSVHPWSLIYLCLLL